MTRGRSHPLPPEKRYAVDTKTGCWIWVGHFPGGKPYGELMIDRRHVKAHRFMWERINGPVPEGLELDHLCKVEACVNPDHLEAVSHTTNVRRLSVCKLTSDSALELHQRFERSSLDRKAFGLSVHDEYGVSWWAIDDALSGRTWRDVYDSFHGAAA